MMDQVAEASSKARRAIKFLLIMVLGVVALVFGLNFGLVAQPVSSELAKDPRNSSFSMRAHYRHLVDPTTLVLDLREVGDNATPIDLFRGLFQAASKLHQRNQRFKSVVLARSGSPVFLMEGEDFAELGAQFDADQNPVYLIRTLPEKLILPDGTAAFDTWEGGWLGVVGKQMEDVNEMAHKWAADMP